MCPPTRMFTAVFVYFATKGEPEQLIEQRIFSEVALFLWLCIVHGASPALILVILTFCLLKMQALRSIVLLSMDTPFTVKLHFNQKQNVLPFFF